MIVSRGASESSSEMTFVLSSICSGTHYSVSLEPFLISELLTSTTNQAAWRASRKLSGEWVMILPQKAFLLLELCRNSSMALMLAWSWASWPSTRWTSFPLLDHWDMVVSKEFMKDKIIVEAIHTMNARRLPWVPAPIKVTDVLGVTVRTILTTLREWRGLKAWMYPTEEEKLK